MTLLEPMQETMLSLSVRDLVEIVGAIFAVAGILVGTRFSIKAVAKEGTDAIKAVRESFTLQIAAMEKALAPHAETPERLATIDAQIIGLRSDLEKTHGKVGDALTKIGVIDHRLSHMEGQFSSNVMSSHPGNVK